MDVYALRISYHNGAGNYIENVIHYNVVSTAGSSPWQVAKDLVTAYRAAVEVNWLLMQAPDINLDYYSSKRVNNGGGPSYVGTVNQPGSWPGANSFSAAIALDFVFISADPSNRPGHLYMGGVPSDAMLADSFTGPYIVAATALIANFELTLTGGEVTTADLCVFNRKLAIGYTATNFTTRVKPTALNKRTLPLV